MRVKHYIPVIIVLVVLAGLVGAQSLLRSNADALPRFLKSRISDAANSLDDLVLFDLELELLEDKKVRMHYIQDEQGSAMGAVRRSDKTSSKEEVFGDDAVEEIRAVVAALPALTVREPLKLIQAVLDQLVINQADVKDFELEYELADGTSRQIELEVDDRLPAEQEKSNGAKRAEDD